MMAAKPLKIVFFTVDEAIGGTEKMLLALACALHGREYPVRILTVRPPGLLHRLARARGIPAFSLHVGCRGASILLPWRLWLFLVRNRPDVLQTFLFAPNILGRVAGRAAAVPVIVGGQRSTDPWRRFYHNITDRLTSPLGRLVVSNSRAGRIMLLKRAGLPPRKVVVIPGGVPAAVPRPRAEAKARLGFPPGGLLVGSVGNLRKAKGYHYLLPAFRELRAVLPEARLVIAGEGPLRKELVDFGRRLGLSGSVFFPGFITELDDFYSALDMFVLSSLWEGMPAALLEAMSYGLPVVATTVSGIPEAVTDGAEGRLVPPANPGLLAAALLDLARDPAAMARMGAAGRRRVADRFSPAVTAGNYAALYRKLSGALK